MIVFTDVSVQPIGSHLQSSRSPRNFMSVFLRYYAAYNDSFTDVWGQPVGSHFQSSSSPRNFMSVFLGYYEAYNDSFTDVSGQTVASHLQSSSSPRNFMSVFLRYYAEYNDSFYRRFGTTCRVPSSKLKQSKTFRLGLLGTLRSVEFQKSADLIYSTAEAQQSFIMMVFSLKVVSRINFINMCCFL